MHPVQLAVTVTLPFDTAVKRPVFEIVATAVSETLHLMALFVALFGIITAVNWLDSICNITSVNGN